MPPRLLGCADKAEKDLEKGILLITERSERVSQVSRSITGWVPFLGKLAYPTGLVRAAFEFFLPLLIALSAIVVLLRSI